VTAEASRDPLAAWRPGVATWVALGAVGALVLVYPFALPRVLGALGARATAALLLLLLATSFLLHRQAPGASRTLELPYLGALRGGLLLLALVTLASGDERALRAAPAGIQLFLCAVFARSVFEPRSLLERAARLLQPRAPDFVGPYCRAVTAVWAALFAVNAVVLAALVAGGGGSEWTAFAGWGVYALLGALSALEYLFRKAWFRHYGAGPVDRLWARVLPAERTERGRRSLAHIRRMHDEMRAAGFEPPPEATRR
jgi:uncharacterized membrane protein